MRILLVNPNYRTVYKYVEKEATMIQPPLGLAYIAAVLRENSFDTRILDLAALDLDLEGAKNEISNIKPNIIGITATTNTIGEAYKIAEAVKSKNNVVVVGGPHTSILPEKTLKECKFIDIVVMGEGEYTMLEIASGNSLKNIGGIAYRVKENIFVNKKRAPILDLDKLPFPAWDLLPIDKYWSPGVRKYPFATIVTSRGCPYGCNFCVNYTVHGKKFRARSPENVVAEIDMLVKTYAIRELNILDDNFTLDPERVEAICNELIGRNYDLIWKTGNGIRADRVDRGLLERMKNAGCYLVAFGIESGDAKILKIINKGETLEQIENAIRWSKDVGLVTEGFFMLGNEGENEDTIRATIDFAKRLDLDIAQFQVYIPLPGSSYYEKIKNEGEIFAKSWADFNAFGKPVFRHGELTPELMERMQKIAYREYYFRPRMILKKLREIRSLKQLRAYLKAGLAVLKFT